MTTGLLPLSADRYVYDYSGAFPGVSGPGEAFVFLGNEMKCRERGCLAGEQARVELERLPTSLHLPADAVVQLREAARAIFRESDEFQRFLSDMWGASTRGRP